MISLEPFIEKIAHPAFKDFLLSFQQRKEYYFSGQYHGDFEKWKRALNILHSLKKPAAGIFSDLAASAVTVGQKNELSPQEEKEFIHQLKQFMPWRKGPYEIFGIKIDTEWRSDWKWDRIKNQITGLNDRHVLDIGCGNGYHCWRMLGAGAKTVFGIDPMLHYIMQFNIFNSYLFREDISVLPLKIEDLSDKLNAFDTVFSMGVLYHRRSPIDHLFELKSFCRDAGELVLETLVIDGEKGKVLVPDDRYAKMRNVWFIPSVLSLEGWLQRCGFKNINLVDVRKTSTDEQRVTDWMQYESLQQFLDKDDFNKTAEGYPAPRRAVFICQAG